ncbi:Hypothetical protein NCS54_00334000 [Fusarium falciforme]|uniref:Hypothetical protein n=1 Tax=Fusarium falciforme TaxID=195108 RepID=UPI002301C23C|nr:Hypothetical protein NCS54_00334000 [Fusarium falciforme]WAO86082.1 Hypothetical protein NCS54_00334000 [Fusarium falciforme]
MLFITQLMLAATAAAAAVNHVEVRQVKEIHIFHARSLLNYTPYKRDNGALFARADQKECLASATSIINSAPTPDPKLEKWGSSRGVTNGSPCSVTAPASLSKELMEYMTKFFEWADGIQDEASEFLDDCSSFEGGSATFSIRTCSTSPTIVFTASDTTETVKLEASSAADKDNAAAARDAGLTPAIAAAVGVIGVVMAL